MKGTAFESDRNEAMKLLQDLVEIKIAYIVSQV